MFASLRSFWRSVVHRARFEQDLDDELQFHLESRAQELIRTGLAPAEAWRRARVEFGSAQAYKDEVRQARGLRLLDDLLKDVRFAGRAWRRHRPLSLAVIVTLTVGIGVTTAVFTLVNAFMFRAYGVPDPSSFARVYLAQAQSQAFPDEFNDPRLSDLPALLGESASFREIAAIRAVSAPLDQDPGEVSGRLTTCNLFALHGPVRPVLGRLLDQRDCETQARVLVLSEPFWRARFGGDPGIVGKVVSYNQQPFVVVGVADRSFNARGARGEVWLPHTLAAAWPASQAWQERFMVAARLRPGASYTQARNELQVRLSQQDRLNPGRRSRVLVTNGSLWQEPGHVAPKWMIVSLLFSALSMVVLLAATNVVTLLLSRAHTRRQEVAVRLALGASRGRLLRMLLTETLLLSIVAAALSMLFARELAPLLLRWMAPGPIDLTLDLDWRVWSFVLAVTVVAALGSGLTPALETLNIDLARSLKGPHAAGGRARRFAGRGVLMGVQVALSLALLAGATLFARSYLGMPGAEVAFPSRQILFGTLQARPTRSPAPVPWKHVQARVAAEVSAVPGVRAVAFSSNRPPGGRSLRVLADSGRAERVESNAVSPSYFGALGLRIVRGRSLGPDDAVTAGPMPVVVSRKLATRWWQDREPLGQHLRAQDGRRLQVVGVASDVIVPGETDGLNLYLPLAPSGDCLLVRFDGDAAAVLPGVRAAIARAEPGVRASLRTIQERFERQAAELKPAARLTLVLGLVALVLAVVGVHGLVAFSARRQLKEIGVRMAMGASRNDVLRALLLPVVRILLLGVAAGLLITFGAAPALARTVQEMDVLDPLPYAGASLLLLAAGLAAMVRPARWALGVDPAVVLREE